MERKLAGFLSEEEKKIFEKAIQEEKEKVAQEKRKLENVAISLLKTGMSEDTIVKLLEISPERVQQIKKEAKI